jgi:hypothetical protein
LKRKKPKSELTADPAVTVFAAIIVGAALSTPFFGWTPIIVVSASILAIGWVLGMLGGDQRR